MKTFTSTIRQNSARWIFIFGLLAGLFFSSGEGIQLMPFPVSESDRSTRNVSVREDNSKSYAFSVFSSRNFSTLLKAKFQKNTNQYLSGEHFTFEQPESRASFCPQFAQNYRESNFRHTLLITDSQSDRAPPVI